MNCRWYWRILKMNNKKIDIFGLDLDSLIVAAINETYGKDEKSLQKKKAKEMGDFKAEVAKEVDEAPDAGSKPVKAEDIVKLFNTMRSGKSLKDTVVRKNFQLYFDSLSGSERVALLSYSQAIADIIAGENTKEDIANQPQPDDYGVEVTVDDDEPKKPSKKEKTAKKKKDGGSDAPIVVGESADKTKELKTFRRINS